MKKIIQIVILLFLNTVAHSQNADERQILQVLHEQTSSWNKGDLKDFMKGYWKNDSLLFVGRSGLTYGFENSLRNYQTNYNDRSKMGVLSFDILKLKKLSPEYYFVVGKWFLKRSIGDVGGHYTLLFRKIKGKWMIVADHSS